MEIGATITISIGLIMFIFGTLFVYRTAGAIINKYGLLFSIASLMSALPLVLMAVSDSISVSVGQNIQSVGIPPYILFFVAQIVVFLLGLWSWLRLLSKVSALKSVSESLSSSIEDSNQKLENISKETGQYNLSIIQVKERIDKRYKDLENITKTPE